MNPEIKTKWVEALRSGRYEQGRSYLRSQGPDGTLRYCCLGVLTELTERTRWDSEEEATIMQDHGGDSPTVYRANGQDGDYSLCGLLPAVQQEAGLSEPLPFLPAEARESLTPLEIAALEIQLPVREVGLSVCNDELKLPFSRIADLIEKYL